MQTVESMEPYEQSELYKLRHTTAHVMAQAVLELFPGAKIGIGPPIDDGFYYDFDLGEDDNGRRRTFTAADLERIEKRMRQILAGKHPLRYRVVTADEARELFQDQPYKLEIIEGLLRGEFNEYGDEEEGPAADLVISTYRHDTFEDLCKGPHVAHTGLIPVDAFQLMSSAATYWRGDESRPMLQRIYGTAWFSKKDLKRHLQLLEEAKKRDHRKLGRELEIYIMDEEVGPGLPLWLPNGVILREELEKLAFELEDAGGYQRVATPHIAKEELYLRSGHLPYYTESMYPPMEREDIRYYLKPMNCPFHHKIYASKPRSYRDLPLRLAEFGMVYRYEQSGELFGLMRVRGAEQNDAHIYCAEDQVEAEFMAVIDLYRYYFELFGIDRYVMRLSLHEKRELGIKYADDEAAWLKTEDIVRQVMKASGVPFEEARGEAAFYGPKIDVQAWSVIGREFSLATNQVDFVQPARFGLTFTNRDGQPEMPYCIHRAPLGAHERYIGFLIEHYGGNFPVWLAPEQARVIPITDAHHEYARQVAARLHEAGIRVRADLGNDRMGNKIRAAQGMKVPYMLIVGDQEAAAETLAVRYRDGEQRNDMGLGEFVAHVGKRIRTRSPEL
ncbi:Threonine--tRNA ligase [Candidatus Promineifilum breve]|uniref:Threonine--tRNA ligase n=1 Tax=Candidatus Promineifilum breve TaxID=1806508 RepID=A0A160T1I6_9CHLR|nr:threonine--tRNA ligase [Candidatus Promineifilum breve]CUS03716.2 Threonine--tRNA ligase [Candidatus Promineifilum breve]